MDGRGKQVFFSFLCTLEHSSQPLEKRTYKCKAGGQNEKHEQNCKCTAGPWTEGILQNLSLEEQLSLQIYSCRDWLGWRGFFWSLFLIHFLCLHAYLLQQFGKDVRGKLQDWECNKSRTHNKADARFFLQDLDVNEKRLTTLSNGTCARLTKLGSASENSRCHFFEFVAPFWEFRKCRVKLHFSKQHPDLTPCPHRRQPTGLVSLWVNCFAKAKQTYRHQGLLQSSHKYQLPTWSVGN